MSHTLLMSQSLKVQVIAAPGHSGSCRFCWKEAYSPLEFSDHISLKKKKKAQQTENKKSTRSFLRNSPHLHFREPGNRIPASVGLMMFSGASADRCYYYKPISGRLGGKGSASQFVRGNNNFPAFAHCFVIRTASY